MADGGARERERRFALRRDRKRDSLGLVIYLKRSRAPLQRPGGPKLRRIVFPTRPNLNVRSSRGGDGDDGDDENDPSLGGEESQEHAKNYCDTWQCDSA